MMARGNRPHFSLQALMLTDEGSTGDLDDVNLMSAFVPLAKALEVHFSCPPSSGRSAGCPDAGTWRSCSHHSD